MTPWRMHSMTFRVLIDSRLMAIRYKRSGQNQVPTFDGRDVIVDDREPRNEVLEALLRNSLLNGELE